MRVLPLGEVARVVSGGTPKTGVIEYWDGDIPWATPTDLSRLNGPQIGETARTITAAGLAGSGATVLPVGSVLLSSRAPIGYVAVNSVPMATNQGFKSLVPGPELTAGYLYHWLRWKSNYLKALGNGATFAEISKRTVERILVPVPLLKEQHRIAVILNAADATRSKRKAVVGRLDALNEAVVRQALTGVTWDARLGDLAHIQIGPFGSLLHREDYVDGGVALINPMHIRSGRLVPDPSYSVSAEKAASLENYRLRAGDVVLARRGEMGRAGVALEEHDGLLCGTGSLILRPRHGVDSWYLHGLVTSRRMRQYFERASLGATLPNLNASIVAAAATPKPLEQDQKRFASEQRRLDDLHAAVHRALAADDELFASLQSRAFSGKL